MTTYHRTLAAVSLVIAFAVGASAQAPVAEPDVYTVAAGFDLVVEAPGVLGNDHTDLGEDLPESATAELVADVTAGTLTFGADGSFSYTYPAGFTGTDGFTYRVVDGATISNVASVTLTVTGCQSGPTATTTVCWVESSFLAALAAHGYGTLSEGFEDDVAWGGARYPSNPTTVVSQGITWSSNLAGNGISTSGGASRTGDWGVYSDPHGDPAGGGTCNPAIVDETCDGWVGLGSGGDSLFGVGGWVVTNTPPGKVQFELTYADASTQVFGFPTETLTAFHQFYGVIDTAGFAAFEVRELEGTSGQWIYIFGDDFTIADGSGADTVPPTVTGVDSFEDTGDGQLTDGEITRAAITDLYLAFSEPVQDLGGDTEPNDVTNPASYLLFDDSGDGFETMDCVYGVAPTDHQIAVDAVTYTSGSQLEAHLEVNGGVALPPAAYRLAACGTSIQDWAGNPLDGDTNGVGGDDFVLDFTVEANQLPVADDQAVTTDEDTAKAITLTASDGNGDPLTFFIWSFPSHGSLTGIAPSVTYTPHADYNGPDSFGFRVWDGTDYSNTGTVSITVNPTNDPPVAVADAYVVAQGASLTVAAPGVLANDDDLDGDDLSAVLDAPPSSAASFTLNSDGSFSYTHDGSTLLDDSFSYVASDGPTQSVAVAVAIDVVDPQPIFADGFESGDTSMWSAGPERDPAPALHALSVVGTATSNTSSAWSRR